MTKKTSVRPSRTVSSSVKTTARPVSATTDFEDLVDTALGHAKKLAPDAAAEASLVACRSARASVN
jgi:hypothetical protein